MLNLSEEERAALPPLPGITDLPRTSSPLLAACADLATCVHELGQACGSEARAQAAAIAARIATRNL